MDSFPRISLITPTYNQGEFIERTIQSVLSQNYPNLEYIIIDGGSKDATVDIIKKYSAHLKYWKSEPDKGQSDAINKGIVHATGDIINWLNSDDWLEDGALKEIAGLFSDSSVDVVCGYASLIYPEKKILKRSSAGERNIARAIAAGHIMQPATFFRKKIFDELTPLETSLHYMMDHYMWLRYISANGFEKIRYSEKILANVFNHEHAKSVGSIDHFRYDRRRIYDSLFRAMNKKIADEKISAKEFLFFPEPLPAIRKEASVIRFYLLYEQLFSRNHLGERKKLNGGIFFRLLIQHPGRFIAIIFKKIFS